MNVMNKNKIIYWASTGLISAMMLMSGSMYFTEDVKLEMAKIGFPDFFRVELGVAKILGVLALLLPMIPKNVKEWAYAGFGIVFISATLLHISMGDPAGKIIAPVIAMIFLAVSYIFKDKI